MMDYTSVAHMIGASLPTTTTLSFIGGRSYDALINSNLPPKKTHHVEAPDEAPGLSLRVNCDV